MFKRFYHEEKPRYRAFLTILAICSAVNRNVADRASDASEEVHRMRRLLQDARALLENHPDVYERRYMQAFAELASFALDASQEGTDQQIAQTMFQAVSRSPFPNLFRKLRMRIDSDSTLAEADQG